MFGHSPNCHWINNIPTELTIKCLLLVTEAEIWELTNKFTQIMKTIWNKLISKLQVWTHRHNNNRPSFVLVVSVWMVESAVCGTSCYFVLALNLYTTTNLITWIIPLNYASRWAVEILKVFSGSFPPMLNMNNSF